MVRRLARSEVRAALLAVLVARTAINAGSRLAYPFLPEIARGLDVSLATAGLLLAVRAAAGLAAPLVPRLTETKGRRGLMLTGLVACLAGALLVGGAPGIVVAGAGFFLIGLAKPLFDIPMQGWFGGRVPYARRGRVLGLTELTWAISLALAAPAGFLIAATTWRAPFLLVAVLTLAGLAAVAWLMVDDRPPKRERRPLHLTSAHVALLGVVVAFRLAAELLFVVYGTWLEDDFGLSVAAIGIFTMVVVASELTGEGAVAAFADRIGLRRMIFAGLVVSAIAYASLNLVDGALPAAIVVVIAWFIAFEITIVATIPLATEQGGGSRERLLALVATAAVAPTGLAAVAGPRLYALGGIGLCGFVAAGLVVVGALLLTRVPARTG